MPLIQAVQKTEHRSVHAAATEFARSHVRMRRLVREIAVEVRPHIDVTIQEGAASSRNPQDSLLVAPFSLCSSLRHCSRPTRG